MFDIHIRTAGLRTAADTFQGTSHQLNARTGHWLDDSLTAASAHSGFASGPALRECADAWQTHMSAVAQQLNTYADQLRQSSHSYETAEQESVRRLNLAVSDLNRGA
ncbi:type VII secretion target [Kitasatospora cineracea]|uniref:Excreted virulence factor EspC (Type VII ESX diderm) n=1 Tax=Kitasatospora cineracea TaxID=88074 RepID=A0A3N4RCV8_9ACTN|nr:type VII secretion target [Kitasatospora cineracea]RPE28491.1 excreted virulence factor EspC (type VII ESX diderm) [Kitasatospora cineracea]